MAEEQHPSSADQELSLVIDIYSNKFGSTFMKINFGEKDVVPVINLRFLPRNP